MKRFMVCLVLMVLVGCGSSNPVSTTQPPGSTEPPSASAQMLVVPVAELLAYLNLIDPWFQNGGPIQIMTLEYGGITADVTQALVPIYWARQFAKNLIARQEALLARVRTMRPENPALREIHIEEFEGAFLDYLDGMIFLEQNMELLSGDAVNELNRRMGAGNVHLIRMEISLSDLAGGPVGLGLGGQGGQGGPGGPGGGP